MYNDRQNNLGTSPTYSRQFATMGSPVPDVPITSPDFDAIIGCIEKEIMDLPNGIEFNPKASFNPLDLTKSLKKIP